MASLNDILNSAKKTDAANRPDPRARFNRETQTYMRALADFNPADNELEKKVLMSNLEVDGVHTHFAWITNSEGKLRKEEVICWKEIQGPNARCPYCAGDYGADFRKVYKYFGTPIYMYNLKFETFNERGEQDMTYGWQRILFAPMFNSPYRLLTEHASIHGSTTNCDFIVNIIPESTGQSDKKKWIYTLNPINFGEPFPVTDLVPYSPADMFKRLSEKLSFEATLNKKDEVQANQQARQSFLTKRPVYTPPTPAIATNGHTEQAATATVVAEREEPKTLGLDNSMMEFMEQTSNRKAPNKLPSRIPVVDSATDPENESPS